MERACGECWVFVEHKDGRIKQASLELMAKGREVADGLSRELAAVVLGWNIGNVAVELARHGADKVYLVEHPLLERYQVDLYCKAVSDLASEVKPDVILFSSTRVGCELAPKVAKRLRTGMTADCLDLRVDASRGLVKQVKASFGGNVMVEVVTPFHRPQIATVKPGVATPVVKERREVVVRVTPKLDEREVKVRVVEKLETQKEDNLELAEVVVAGGRGAGEEGFRLIRRLAEILGGEIGGTRPAADEGWIPRERQIGQSGRIVSPKIYISLGASGALQHVVGFRRAGLVIAVNKDPRAPIFDHADVGVVADVKEFLEALIQELEKYLNAR
ncbi:MAG: electron transfer flavoprotein subunit alpha/FixB family protein [Candidatus Jordarchaeales archaeon]